MESDSRIQDVIGDKWVDSLICLQQSLRLCTESNGQQLRFHQNWQNCVHRDGSTATHVDSSGKPQRA